MWPPKSLHHCILTQFGAFGHKHKTGAKIKKKTSARSFSNKVRTAGAAVLFAARGRCPLSQAAGARNQCDGGIQFPKEPISN